MDSEINLSSVRTAESLVIEAYRIQTAGFQQDQLQKSRLLFIIVTTPSMTSEFYFTCLLYLIYFTFYIIIYCGPGSSVGIATDYGLDGPEIATRWG